MYHVPLDKNSRVPLDLSKGTRYCSKLKMLSTSCCTYVVWLYVKSFFSVPRSKVGKTREGVSTEYLKHALEEIRNGTGTIRSVSKKWNITKSTLHNYIKKQRNNPESNISDVITPPNYAVHKIFNESEEYNLVQHLEKAAYLHFGLTKHRTRKLAYDYSKILNKKIPPSWEINKLAGKEWLIQFRKRWPNLSLRKPEPTSLARASSFNKTNVQNFFNNYTDVMARYKFTPDKIYNLDETSNFTVHKPSKVLAPKNIKQLGSLTSAERGINITMVACVNAIGNSIPPLFIFPRVNFKDHMLHGAPPGSIGAANPSGWSTEPIFQTFLDHLINHAKPTPESPILVIMDNHETHISIPIIDKAKDNGIVLLTLHPHTSHKMQPLDRSVFGPYKVFYNKAAENWMLANPGKPITIYDVAGIAGKAYLQAFNPTNIIKGFEVSGLWPVNVNIFPEEDFLQSYVTDRPDPTTSNTEQRSIETEPISSTSRQDYSLQSSVPSTSQQYQINPDASSLSDSRITQQSPMIPIESFFPFPKASARKNDGGRGRRKKGKTRILTDTPEKTELEKELSNKKTKKKLLPKDIESNIRIKKKLINDLEPSSSKHDKNMPFVTYCDTSDDDKKTKKKPLPKDVEAKTRLKKKLIKDQESSSSEEDDVTYCETSDDDNFIEENEEKDEEETSRDIEKDNFLLVKLATKKLIKHYVAKVVEKLSGSYLVKFYKKMKKFHHFIEGNEIPYEIDEKDIVLKLPDPEIVGGTERLRGHIAFKVSFDAYNMS